MANCMYGVLSTPGVGGLKWSMGRTMTVPLDDDEETGFRGILRSAFKGAGINSSSVGSLCLTGRIVGMVASNCFASDFDTP